MVEPHILYDKPYEEVKSAFEQEIQACQYLKYIGPNIYKATIRYRRNSSQFLSLRDLRNLYRNLYYDQDQPFIQKWLKDCIKYEKVYLK